GTTYDIILTGGDTVQLLRERDLYQPLVQMAGPGIFAVIAVQADSAYETLDDLRDEATVATADLLAYSTGLGFRRLRAAGIDPQNDLDLVYVPSQSAALAVLTHGQVDASIIMMPIVRTAAPEVRDRIRVIAETELAPPPAISVSTAMPPDLTDRIHQFFLSFEDSEGSSAMLKDMGWPGLIPVRISDYDALDWAADSMAERLNSLAD
ncbi:MAG: PhnD/SsuA/transferrin family substrate-binding protein, partial [Paracoccaceae bacterium]|nr:PhnD/SsuA/transferrin family substrate-binding protein [Paracoccaceae bacterium]